MKIVTISVSDELAELLVEAADSEHLNVTIVVEDAGKDNETSYEFTLKDVEDVDV